MTDRGPLERALAEQAGAMREFTQRLDEVRGHGEGADGRVRIEVTAAGRVTDLRLDPHAMRLGSELLTEQIMAAIEAAITDAGRQVQEALDTVPSNPSWEELITGTAQADPSLPLRQLPDSTTLDGMIRRAAQ
jgi:DNA-binding protein YbaB